NASNYLSNLSAIQSDLYSLLSDTRSTMDSQFVTISALQSDILSGVRGNSDALSDLLSRINSASFLSDIASHVWAAKYSANSAASTFGSLVSDIFSRVALVQTTTTQVNSRILVMSGILSDAYSGIVALSDAVSNAYSAAAQANSRILVMSGILS